MKIEPEDTLRLLSGFEDYLCQQRGLREKSLPNYTTVARGFLGFLRKENRELDDAAGPADFLASCKLARGSLWTKRSALRQFYCFLKVQGLVKLKGDIPTISLSTVHQEILTAYGNELKACRFSTCTWRGYLSIARSFLRYLEAKGLSVGNGAEARAFLEARKIGRRTLASMTSQLRAFCDFLERHKKLDSNALGPVNPNFSYKRPNRSEKKSVEDETPLRGELQAGNNAVIPIAAAKDRLELEGSFIEQKLRREVEYLKNEIQRLTEAVSYRNRILEEQGNLWQLGLDHRIWPTMGEALRLVTRLKGAIGYCGPAYPEMPAGQGQGLLGRARSRG